MKNILGTQENLRLYNKAGNLVYEFTTDSKGFSWEVTRDKKGNELAYKCSDGYSWKSTWDEKGSQLTFKDSNGYSWERTYDSNGYELTYKNSNGFWCERTYDDDGEVLTYKDSNGIKKGFENVVAQEFTMEQLVIMVGNFKLIK